MPELLSDQRRTVRGYELWKFLGTKPGRSLATGVVTLVGAFVTALVGPLAVQKVTSAIEREKIRSQLATEVLRTVRELDPQDPKSVARLGVIATLLGENFDTFHLSTSAAKTRLDHLANELADTPLTRSAESVERKDAEIAALEAQHRATQEALAGLEAQQASAKGGTPSVTADAERRRVAGALQLLDERTQALAELLRRSREADELERRAILARLREVTAPTSAVDDDPNVGEASVRELRKALARAREESRTSTASLERLGRAWKESADELERLHTDARTRAAAEERLRVALRPMIDEKVVEMRNDRGEITVLVPAAQLRFAPGRCEARNPAVITKIAYALKQIVDRRFQVRGHTDATGQRRKNWELSSCRARVVAEALVGHGVEEARLSYAAFASTQPIDARCTPGAHDKNRRVEIAVLPLENSAAVGELVAAPAADSPHP